MTNHNSKLECSIIGIDLSKQSFQPHFVTMNLVFSQTINALHQRSDARYPGFRLTNPRI